MSKSVVATFTTMQGAEAAIRKLADHEFPVEHVSIVSKDLQSEKEVHGFVTRGDVAGTGAGTGAWMGGIFGLLIGAAFLWVPGVGALVVAGPLAAALLGGLEGATVGAGAGALLGVLAGWGVDKKHILKYEEAVSSGSYLVVVHGDAGEIAEARKLLDAADAESVEVHLGDAAVQLPPDAQVYGSDDHIGHATQVIVDPVSKTVTHLVVKAEGIGGQERLVPLEAIVETHENRIDLKGTVAQFGAYQAFTETHFVEVSTPTYLGYANGYPTLSLPYANYVPSTYTYKVKLIPENELALKRGMRVDANDGRVGRIDEFVVDAEGHIGHLLMRQGHIFGEKDVFIPVSDIEKINEDHVLLNLSKREVDELVRMPVHRPWENDG